MSEKKRCFFCLTIYIRIYIESVIMYKIKSKTNYIIYSIEFFFIGTGDLRQTHLAPLPLESGAYSIKYIFYIHGLTYMIEFVVALKIIILFLFLILN